MITFFPYKIEGLMHKCGNIEMYFVNFLLREKKIEMTTQHRYRKGHCKRPSPLVEPQPDSDWFSSMVCKYLDGVVVIRTGDNGLVVIGGFLLHDLFTTRQ